MSTIREIAKKASVSTTTVSRVLNDRPDVSPETKKLIKQIMKDLDYQPNANAKAISSKRSNNIGIIIPYAMEYIFSNPYYSEVLRGLSVGFDRKGYYILICYPHEQNYLNIYNQKRVGGFVLVSPTLKHESLINALIEKKVPFISTSNMENFKGICYVDIDNYYGGKMATEYLVSLGYKKIGFIGKESIASSVYRYRGYLDVLKEKGLEYNKDFKRITEFGTVDKGYNACKSILKSKDRPEAIFVASDFMAIGVIRACHEKGLKIPEDISIIGFDDLELSKYTQPSLTTIKQPAYEKGIIASNLLVKSLENWIRPESKIMDIELVVRESTIKK